MFRYLIEAIDDVPTTETYFVYKVINDSTKDTFLIYSEDEQVLRDNVEGIVKELTETENDLAGAYDDIGISIVSNDETFGLGTYTQDEDGSIFINGKPIKIIGVQTFRF